MAATPSNPREPPARLLAQCNALVLLARTKHYVLHTDRLCHLLIAQRTAAAFEHCSQIPACFEEIGRTIASLPLPRHHYKLLVDTRGGPSRNDPDFEAVLSEHRGKLLLGFAKNAALATTAAGGLQIQRYAKNDGRVVFVTDTPESAFHYLGLPAHSVTAP